MHRNYTHTMYTYFKDYTACTQSCFDKKNKTLYDEIKLLFQANFHLHHNCAKNTRKLGWHLIYCSFGLPPCTANTQSLGFFHHVNDWRKTLFFCHKFCQLHNSNNKNEQKWQQSNNNNNSCNLHFFLKTQKFKHETYIMQTVIFLGL